jgi:UDP:flavonoid glycosyltransferase YjiC (YdhE family)
MLAECVLLAKPVLAVYRDGDAEQCLNATLVERAGVGLGRPIAQGVRATDEFVRRVSSRDFTCVDLANALPPLSLAVRRTLAEI